MYDPSLIMFPEMLTGNMQKYYSYYAIISFFKMQSNDFIFTEFTEITENRHKEQTAQCKQF